MSGWSTLSSGWQQNPKILEEILESLYVRGLYGLSDPLEKIIKDRDDEDINILGVGSPAVQDFRVWRDIQARLLGDNQENGFFVAEDAQGGNMKTNPYVREFFVKVESDAQVGTYNNSVQDTQALFADAGITNGFFRKATEYDPSIHDWTDRNDPMYTTGYASSGDILGPWLVEDIRLVLDRLLYIRCASSASLANTDHTTDGLGFDVANRFSAFGSATINRYDPEYGWESGLPDSETMDELDNRTAANYSTANATGWLNTTQATTARLSKSSSFIGTYDPANPNWSDIDSVTGSVGSRQVKLYAKTSESKLDDWPFPTDVNNIEKIIIIGDGGTESGQVEPLVVPIGGSARDVEAIYTASDTHTLSIPLSLPSPFSGGGIQIVWSTPVVLIMKIDAPYIAE